MKNMNCENYYRETDIDAYSKIFENERTLWVLELKKNFI
jgi:hypothetical protein